MSNLEKIYSYKDNFSKIGFIVLIMVLKEKHPGYDILQNTVKAQMVGIKSIPLSLVVNITKINEYREYKKYI